MDLLRDLREEYHKRLCSNLLAWRQDKRGQDRMDKKGRKVPNIADIGSDPSMDLAGRAVANMGHPIGRLGKSPQTLGKLFADYTRDFLDSSFSRLNHLRPGPWLLSTSQAEDGIAAYSQYEHLSQLQRVLDENPELKAALGGDYIITPDIIVARTPVSDDKINENGVFIDSEDEIGAYSPLRAANTPNASPILHASISMKWTMRSDRAQNTRTEALNLVRHRKGNAPHIVVVTLEPLPLRLASIAMGTGDIDCTYHAALHELLAGAAEADRKDQLESLQTLVEGRRLRDISDLPLDLAI